MSSTIAVFGMGIIGSIWADHWERDGLKVARWNRSPKPGVSSDAAATAKNADTLVLVVADPAAVQAVLDVILPVLRPEQLVIQCSTVGTSDTHSYAKQVRATGASFLEAPFTGSKPSAEIRKVVYFVGGEPALLERARPLLQRVASNIEHIGEIGSASALKLAMNVNAALVVEALCESYTVARNAGIPADRYFAILRTTTIYSKLAEIKEPKLKGEDYAPQFSVKHMAKDLRLALRENSNLRLPQTMALLKLYEEAIGKGWQDDDFVSLVRLMK